eukprot:TRINITY_DN1636_c0_g1_i3.p1 TRINITY_DN1636_c0_g1~~TRINITY_DN1636_c0_g1_i3.p1  ORF type:complete len:177 (-),score=40.59 TRINITY_DN1636_c0_g1_i3:29-487(-)
MEEAIAAGANVMAGEGKYGGTALHYASQGGHFECVELLIAQKANVNALDYGGSTPLHLAAKNGHNKICRFLLNNGAKQLVKDKRGRVPLDDVLSQHTTRLFEEWNRNNPGVLEAEMAAAASAPSGKSASGSAGGEDAGKSASSKIASFFKKS